MATGPREMFPKSEWLGIYVMFQRPERAGTSRREAFEKGVTTSHNPAHPEFRYARDRVYQEFEQYLEDSNHIQPKINLTTLGRSLLGYN